MDRALHIHALRQSIAALGAPPSTGALPPVALGADGPDDALGGGLARGALHEIVAASGADAPAAAGFVAALALRAARGRAGAAVLRRRCAGGVLWLRERLCEVETGKLYPPAFAAMGLDPSGLVHGRFPDAKSLLRAAAEAAACPALSAVVIEPAGSPAILDLTATRRLALAAEASGVALLLFRPSGRTGASAAETRWRISAAPSLPLEANAPGHPVFDIELLRNKGGRDGLSWRLEWTRETQCFTDQALRRPVAAAPADRPARAAGEGAWRRAG